MVRPTTYANDTVVSLSGKNAKSRLQAGSERRAIVHMILDNGGAASLAEIDKHFGYDIRQKVIALVKAGWLETEQ